MHLLALSMNASISTCEDRLRTIRRKSNMVSLIRLLLFAALVYVVYLLFQQYSLLLLFLSLGVLAGFIGCVNLYFRLKDKRALWEQLVFVNTNERGLLAGKANGFPDGVAFLHPDNYLDDLDIFGVSSLFHLLNRTTTLHGETALASLLRNTSLAAGDILARQEAIRSLAAQADCRRLLTATGRLATGKAGDLRPLGDWLRIKPRLYQHKALRVLIVIAVLTIFNCWTILYFLSSNNYTLIVAGILVCRLLTGYFSKSVSREHQLISHQQAILEQYADILSVFSTIDAGGSAILQELKTRARVAHTAIRQLSRLASFFEQQHNLLVNVFLNSLIFYDLQCLIALERWKARYKAELPGWIEAVGSIECLNSLATFAFNNPEYVYPLPVAGGEVALAAARGGALSWKPRVWLIR